MVSLMERSEYIQQLESDEYTATLVDFLLGKNLSRCNYISTSNANEISKFVFYALQRNDQAFFLQLYDDIVQRKPKPESEWMHNDTLLFALILGVKKFKLNGNWLEEVLKIRINHSRDDGKLVAQTFIDISKDNLENNNNYRPLMIVMKYFLDLPLGDVEYVNSVYQDLVQKSFPYSKVAFLNLICLRALDTIILSKGLIDLKRQKAIDEFVVKFNHRVTQMATTLWVLLATLTLSASILLGSYYFYTSSQQVELINRILAILSFLGLGGSINTLIFVQRKKLIEFFKRPFLKYYGYKLEKTS